jgi:hypothetical protein
MSEIPLREDFLFEEWQAPKPVFHFGPIIKRAFAPLTKEELRNLLYLRPNAPNSWMQTGIGYDKAVLLARSFMVRVQRESFFRELVLNKAYFATLIWRSAFVYRVPSIGQTNEEMSVFVKLRKDTDKDEMNYIDVVVVKENADGALTSMVAAYRELACLSRLLREFCPQAVGPAQPLCPMCCNLDLFVRLGHAHTFSAHHVLHVSAETVLQCSSFHRIPVSDILNGRLVVVNRPSLPLLFPGNVENAQGLVWDCVRPGGVLCSSFEDRNHEPVLVDAGECLLSPFASNFPPPPHNHVSSSFLAMSFFVVTGQVDAGDCLHSDELARFEALVMKSRTDACTERLRLSDGRIVHLQFRFSVGDIPARPGNRRIVGIFPADVGDALSETPSLSGFSCLDNVLVIFEKAGNDKRNEFRLFYGSKNNLRICRLTPSSCNMSLDAAVCWSQLQDQLTIGLGDSFEYFEMTALQLYRNDERARAFVQQMSDMQLRRREAAPPWEDRGRVAGREVAALGGEQFVRYGKIFERGDFDWARAGTSSDEKVKKVKKEVQRVGVSKEHADKVVDCVMRLQHTFDSQEATMRHFKDHSGKFGLLPADKNEDVNLTLAWWSNWRDNAL